MPCLSCAETAAENARLRDEVQAWRASDREAERGDADLDRLGRWKAAFPELSPAVLLTVMAMVDRSGRVCSAARLDRALTASPFARTDERLTKNVDVVVFVARRAFRRRGESGSLPRRFAASDGGIVNHRGLGWSIEADAAAVLSQKVGEA